jgi:hypothetical protein
LAISGLPAPDFTDPGDVDPEMQMGIVLCLIAVLTETGATVSTNNVRALVTAYERLVDIRLAAAGRQLAQMSLLGFLSPIPSPGGDVWELTDNDFAAVLREDADAHVAHVLDALRARASRLARAKTHQIGEKTGRSPARGTPVALIDNSAEDVAR